MRFLGRILLVMWAMKATKHIDGIKSYCRWRLDSKWMQKRSQHRQSPLNPSHHISRHWRTIGLSWHKELCSKALPAWDFQHLRSTALYDILAGH